MKRRFFLTSLVVMGLMRPALAETFPADGYMQEDKTYENAATYTNLGKYEGEVTATAEYTDIAYSVGAGTYLPAGAEVAATCTAGNFCTGMADATYNETDDQGLSACPEGYPNSAAGASAQTQCYTACKVSDIAHATGVSGNDYFGDGTDTCKATGCDKGYNVYSDIKLIDKSPIVPVDYTNPERGWLTIDADGVATTNNIFSGVRPPENNTWAVYYENGTVSGRASCQPSGTPAYEYYRANQDAVFMGLMTFEEFERGLADASGDAVKAKYFTDILRKWISGGNSDGYKLAEVFVMAEFDANYSTDSTGKKCFCQITGFTPNGGSYESVNGAPWLSVAEYTSEDSCPSNCLSDCGRMIVSKSDYYDTSYKSVIFDSVELVDFGGTCEQSLYNIPTGSYLPKGSEGVAVKCPENSFCPGLKDAIYNEEEAQGINTCPIEYPSSEAGAGAQTQCYTGCDLASVEHAAAVSGNQYYGGTNTCTPTSCNLGYHKVAGEKMIVKQSPLVPLDYTVGGNGYAYIDASGTAGNDNFADAALTENNTWVAHFDNGILYGQASCQTNYASAALDYVFANMELLAGGTMSYEDFESGLAEIAGEVKASYVTNEARSLIDVMLNGTISEEELNLEYFKMLFAVGTEFDANYSTADVGTGCYCHMTGFTPTGGNYGAVDGAPWVYVDVLGPLDDCMSECASNCAGSSVGAHPSMSFMFNAYRAGLFGSYGLVGAGGMCDANDITINWSDAEEIGDAGMCKYGGDIKTPVKAVAKKGKTFKGWKFSKAN